MKRNELETWTTKDGKTLHVDDMDEQHVRNTLKLILRTVNSPKSTFKKEITINGELAQEDADNYDIHKATGMLPDDFEYDIYNKH